MIQKSNLSQKTLIIGAGFVGLPLAILVAKRGHSVFIYDKNIEKCDNLRQGISGINKNIDEDLYHLQLNKKIKVLDSSTISRELLNHIIDNILICVPTPLQKDKIPDLSMVEEAGKMAASVMTASTLIILESSTYPGTTREILLPLIENRLGDVDAENLLLGYSPERIDPGNRDWNSDNTVRIISGLNKKSLEAVKNFYENCGIPTHAVNSLEIAEAAKLFENTFRLINIAFVNEFVEVVRRIGLEPQEILEAAYTKPFGIMKFKSSPGIGGHCIPIDPYYLTWWVSKFSEELMIVEAAQKANEDMPNSVLNRVKRQLGSELKGKAVVLIGVTYKPKIRDARETPAEGIWRILEDCGCKLYWWDSLLHEWKGRERFKPSVDEIDLALIVTPTKLDFQLSEEIILDLNL